MNGARRTRALVVACVAALVCLVTAGSATAATIAAGDSHSCAVSRAGDVFCWGANDSGQLGDGTMTARAGPVKVSGLTDVTALAAGGTHTCALLAGGTVSCWGANGNGQLGDGTTTQSSTPVTVSGITDAVQIAAGATHSCALLSDGSVDCWGDNANGRLGDGGTTQRLTPVSVSGLVKASSLSIGNAHTCAVKDGGVWCWGRGSSGQLGDGTTNSSSTPVAASGISDAQQVAAGGAHSCARVAGAVKCWGDNGNGQLGDGTTASPRLAPVTVGSLSGVTQLDAGGSHTCAADSTPRVTCWGLNTSGQIGDNSTTQRTAPTEVGGLASPLALSAGTNHTCALDTLGVFRCWGAGVSGQIGDDGMVQRLAPAIVPRLAGGRASAGGTAHTCTALSAGSFWCWGTNGAGQLGVGDSSLRPLPTRTYFADEAFAVAAGQTHSCAIVSGGQAKCWGSDANGQLGDDATLASKNLPVNVSGISTAIRIATGSTHSCAIVSGGQAKCWGSDGNLQLGDDAIPSNKAAPVDVSGLTNAIEISAGGTTSCAIVSGGQAKCWGNNVLGQIGNGNTTNQSAPTSVTGVTSTVAIANGLSHSCAIISGGTVKCWGFNGSGQLGNNSTTNSSTAVTVSGVTGATVIEAGDNHSCALVTLGAVKCWGAGSFGQLGDGLSTQSLVPVDVSGLLGVTAITAGQNHTCAIQAVGRETCWGYANGHQLGNGSTSNRSTPFEVELMLEPLIRFDSIGEGEFIQNPHPSISFSTADVISPMIECNLDGGGWSTCSSPFTPPGPLSLGRHSLQIRASGTDFVDGPISYSSLSFAVSTVLPSVSIASPASGVSTNDNTPTVTFVATGQGALTTTCQIDSGASNACASPYTAPTIADGTHTITVKVVDANTNVATGSISLTVDTVAPNTTITANPPALSTSANASLSFSSTETGTFECRLDAGGWGACASPLAYSSLAEGSHSFQTRAIDDTGNIDATPAGYGWNVDTIAPDTTISANAAFTSSTAASFTLGATETAAFSCKLDGASYSSCTSPHALSGLSEGAHTLSVYATDLAGNADPTPASRGWTVDSLTPGVSISSPAAAFVASVPPVAFTVSDATATAKECRVDAGAYATCGSPFVPGALAEGAHTVYVRATDQAGNQTVRPVGFTLDSVAPSVQITTPASGGTTGDSTPPVNFSVTDATATSAQCKVNGGSWAACSSPFTPSVLADGPHTISVSATDQAGNGGSASVSFTVDSTYPTVAISSPATGQTTADNTPTAAFSATGSALTSECKVDSGSFAACASGGSLPALADGAHTLTVRVTDSPLARIATDAASFTVDTTAPVVSFNSPAEGSVSGQSSVNVSYGVADATAVTVTCTIDAAPAGACGSPIAAGPLDDGPHQVVLHVTDAAGNAADAPVGFTVDTTAPVVTIASPAPGATLAAFPASIQFSASDATTIGFACAVDGGTYAACSSPFTPTLAAGSHNVSVRATDAGGNQGTSGVTFTLAPPAPPPTPPTPVPSPAPPIVPAAAVYAPVVLAKQSKLKLTIILLLKPPAGVTAVCAGKVAFGGKLKRTKLRALAVLAPVGSYCAATARVKLKPGTRGKLKLTVAFAGSSQIAAVTTARAVKLK